MAKQILSAIEIEKNLSRIANEIAKRNMYTDTIAMIGIVRRGVPLAQRLAKKVEALTGQKVLVGSLDITLYGANHQLIDRFPVLNGTDIPFSIRDIPVILVDDILYTGKTIHKAVNALLEQGDPSEIQLATFLDRGRRSFPISADYVGTCVPSSHMERVALHLSEVDGLDEVIIEKRG